MRITIIGGGNMGGAIAKGLANSKSIAPENITVVNRSESKNEEFVKYGITSVTNDYHSITTADVVILAIKPWMFEDFINQHTDLFSQSNAIIISIAAGISLSDLEKWLNRKTSVYLVMPNTAIEVRESVNFVSTRQPNSENDKIVISLFSLLGKTFMIDESKMQAAMALCSCGIAFAMRYIRASMEAGVELGLTPSLSKEGILQTLKGAVALLEAKDSHPEEEIDKVTTPGGITIKGVNELEHNGFSSAIIKALKSCK